MPDQKRYQPHHKLLQRLIGLTPRQEVVQITDKCNTSCPPILNTFYHNTLDQKSIFIIIDAAGTRGIKAISFTGGEQLLMQDNLYYYILRAGAK